MDLDSCSRNDLLCRIDDLEDELKEKKKEVNSNVKEIQKNKQIISELRLHSVTEEEHQDLKSKYDSIKKNVSKLRTEADQLTEDNAYFRKLNDNLSAQLQKQDDKNEVLGQLKKELTVYQQSMEILSTANEELDAEIKSKNEQLSRYKSELETLKIDYDKLKECVPRNKFNESLNMSNLSLDANASYQDFSFSGGISVNRLPSFVGETVADMKIPLLEQEIEELKLKIKSAESELMDSKKIVEQLNSQLFERDRLIETQIDTLKSNQDQISTSAEENNRLHNSISSYEEKISFFLQEKEDMSKQICNKDSTIKQLESNLTEMKRKLVQSDMSLSEKSAELATLQQTHDELIALKQSFEQQLISYSNSVEQLTYELDLKKVSVKELEANLDESQNRFKLLDVQFDQKCLDLEQSQSLNEEMGRSYEDLEQKLQTFKVMNNEFKDNLEQSNSTIALLKSDLEKEYVKLAENISALNAKSHECVQLEENVAMLNDQVFSHKSVIDEQKEELSHNATSLAELESILEHTKSELCDSKSLYKQKCAALEELNEKHSELTQLKDCLEKSLADRDFLIHNLNEELTGKSAAISQMESNLIATEGKLTDLLSRYESISDDFIALKQELKEKSLKHTATVQSLTGELSKQAAIINNLEVNLTDSERLLVDFRNQITILNDQLSGRQTCIDELQNALTDVQSQFKGKCDDFSILNQKFADLTGQKQTLEHHFAQSKDNVAQLSSDLTQKSSIIERYQLEVSQIKSIVLDSQSKFEKLQQEFIHKSETVVQLEGELSAVCSKLSDAELVIKENSQELTQLNVLKQSLERIFQQKCTDMVMLEQRFNNEFAALMQQLTRKDSALNEIDLKLQETESKREDLVAQLERISAEYDTLSHKSNTELSILKQDFQKQTSEFVQQQDQAKRSIQEKETLIQEFQASIEKLQNEITDQAAIERSKDVIITELSSSLEESEGKVIEIQSLLDSKSIQYEELKQSSKVEASQIEQIQVELTQAKEKADKYKDFAERITKDFDALEKELEALKAKAATEATVNTEELKRKVEQLSKTNVGLQNNIRSRNIECKQLQNDLEMEKTSFKMERRTKERLIKENQNLDFERNKLKRRVDELTAACNESSTVCKKCRSGSSLHQSTEHFVVNVNTNLHHVPTIAASPHPMPHRLSNRFEMAEEEGQFMDPNSIDSAQLFGNGPSSSNESFASAFELPQQSKEERIQQLIHRNSMLQPHLRSTYPVELQEVLDSVDENSIRSGSCMSSMSSISSIGTLSTTLSTVGRANSVVGDNFQRPSLPRTRSHTQLGRQIAQSLENVQHPPSRPSSAMSVCYANSAKRPQDQQRPPAPPLAFRRPAPTSFSISTENLTGKKAKKENTLRATLTPSKILKRVIQQSKRTWTPTKSKK